MELDSLSILSIIFAQSVTLLVAHVNHPQLHVPAVFRQSQQTNMSLQAKAASPTVQMATLLTLETFVSSAVLHVLHVSQML